LAMPAGGMAPLGYIVMQHGMKENRPVKAYQRWMEKIPPVYRKVVLDQTFGGDDVPAVLQDTNMLAQLKHYRSLMPLAMQANKPMFKLKPADGAIGAHVAAVTDCHRDFLTLARKIALAAGLSVTL
jgi:chromosome partitioning protein